MATVSTNKGVAGIPLAALDAIPDENTRQVLAALVEGWHVRNGTTGNGDGRFVTKAELTQQAFKTQQAATTAAGSSSSTQTNLGTIKPGQIAQIINDVQASVFASQLWSDLGSRISLIQIDSTQNAADIKTETQKRINADNAIVQTTTTQFAVLNGNVAAVQQQVTTIANTVSAYSQMLTTLQSQVGANTSALQIEATTRANADNEMLAKFSVKIDQNGYVSGFGLMSTANNSTPYSRFIVRADQFAIGSPSGPGIQPAVPFVVLTTYDAKGNPPGVYMDSAYMKKASVGTLMIDGNAVTVPAAAYSGWGSAIGTSYTEVQVLYFNRSAGADGYAPMVGFLSYTHQNNGGSYFDDSHTVIVRVVRTADGAEVYWGSFSAAGAWTTPYSASFRDTFAGATYYSVQVSISKGVATGYYRALTLLETRR